MGGLGVVPVLTSDTDWLYLKPYMARQISPARHRESLAVLLSALLMLDFMGEKRLSRRIRSAIEDVLDAGTHLTGDLGGSATPTNLHRPSLMRCQRGQMSQKLATFQEILQTNLVETLKH